MVATMQKVNDELEAEGQAATSVPSKADLINEAMKAGKRVPKEGVAWIKEQYGINVDKGYFSTHKSMVTHKRVAARAEREQRKERLPVVKTIAPDAIPVKAGTFEGFINDTKALRGLVLRYGKSHVQAMLDLVN